MPWQDRPITVDTGMESKTETAGSPCSKHKRSSLEAETAQHHPKECRAANTDDYQHTAHAQQGMCKGAAMNPSSFIKTYKYSSWSSASCLVRGVGCLSSDWWQCVMSSSLRTTQTTHKAPRPGHSIDLQDVVLLQSNIQRQQTRAGSSARRVHTSWHTQDGRHMMHQQAATV
jgi:hypothetical protein